MRPKCVLRNAKLVESVSTDAERAAAGYRKTGDLITLNYTDVELANQPYATRIENLFPYLAANWVGIIKLTPAGDEWFETEIAPELIINVEGNYDTVLAENRNSIGTVWNSWETQWSGVVSSSTSRFVSGNSIIQRTVQTTRTDLARTGLQTDVVEDIVEESQGFKVISRALIPFIRPRVITFEGDAFLPNTRVYVFFDKQDVNAFVTPLSSDYTSDTTIVAGSPLITTAAGKVEGTFEIPEYRFPGTTQNPRFRTGETEFRITSSPVNERATQGGISKEPLTAANTIYHAVGILETEQETIIATRNAQVVQTKVSQTTSRNTSTSSQRVIGNVDRDNDRDGPDRDGGGSGGTAGDDRGGDNDDGPDGPDPLAQTFLIEEPGGCFLTKADLFYQLKDNVLPTWVEIRNVVNGYPGPKILPFGRKLLPASEINVSDNGTVPTTFVFDSPVFLQEGNEYCIVLRTTSPNYRTWDRDWETIFYRKVIF